MWKMDVTRTDNEDIFRFAERNKKKFADVVIIETQSMSMIKVEFTISVKMSKKNLKKRRQNTCCSILQK